MSIFSIPQLESDRSVLEIGDKSTFDTIDAALGLVKYGPSNPHPGFGKDPNILNVYGHSKYPMWITSKITGQRMIVENAMEEAQHTGGAAAPVASVPQSPATPVASVPVAPKEENPWG